MGLFGNLFEKKECAICGGEIGLLGNRKLEDGNMCKNCAKLLSPWFNDRRSSTVAEIKEQLAYREANKEKVASFRTTQTLGERTKVLLDEDAGVFMVTAAWDLAEANPDVLAFSDVTGCTLDIDESRTEIKREDENGNRVSYNPPRYTYSYDFRLIIHVRNPYFDEIRITLNDHSVELESQAPRYMSTTGVGRYLSGSTMSINPEYSVEYRHYKQMGEEIRDALLQVRQQARDTAIAASTPKAVVICPYCGATTTPDSNGCCEFCGGALGE